MSVDLVEVDGVAWDELPVLEQPNGKLEGVLSAVLDRAAREIVDEKEVSKDESCAGLGARAPALRWRVETDPHVMRLKVLGTKRRMMVPMLRDEVRNAVYADAIERAVKSRTHASGIGPRVLDIGAGTGFLSLLAARAGASHVLGCEMNKPLAEIARQVVGENKLDTVIDIVGRHSSSVEFKEEDKADIIVTETLDSNLLEEGIIESVQMALHGLAKSDAIVIPGRGRVFGQVFGCGEGEMEGLSGCELHFVDGMLEVRERSANVFLASDSVSNLANFHAGKIPGLFSVTDAFEIFEIDFAKPGFDDSGRKYNTVKVAARPSTNNLNGHSEEVVLEEEDRLARFMIIWWELDVGSNVEDGVENAAKRVRREALRTTPDIQESEHEWQDHWFPVLAPLAQSVPLAKSKLYEFHFTFCCTATKIALVETETFEFAHSSAEPVAFPGPISGSPAEYGISVNNYYKRERMGQLANSARTKMIKESLEAACESLGVSVGVLDVSDGSLCALLASSFAEVAVSLDRSDGSADLWRPICKQNVDIFSDSTSFIDPFEVFNRETSGLSTVQWLTTHPKCPRRFAVSPSRARVVGSIVEFTKLGSVMRAPRVIRDLGHEAPANIWNDSKEMFPIPLWSYEHRFETEVPIGFFELDYAAGGLNITHPEPVTVKLLNKYSQKEAFTNLGLVVWVEVDSMPPARRWYDKHLVRFLEDEGETIATILNLAKFSLKLERDSNTLSIKAEVL